MPASSSWRDPVRRHRDRDQHDEVRDQADRGGELEHRAVGGRRDDVLLLGELHAVGDQLGPAVEAAGVHRPEPALHVRHRLVLGLPDQQRQGEEARPATSTSAQHHLEQPRSAAGPTPRGRVRRVAGSCAGSGPRPRRTPPAPWRPARPWPPGPPARRPCAAGGPRSRPAAAAAPGAGGRRSRRRTSRTSRARARTRRRRHRSPWPASARRPAPGCAAAGARGGPSTRGAPRRRSPGRRPRRAGRPR